MNSVAGILSNLQQHLQSLTGETQCLINSERLERASSTQTLPSGSTLARTLRSVRIYPGGRTLALPASDRRALATTTDPCRQHHRRGEPPSTRLHSPRRQRRNLGWPINHQCDDASGAGSNNAWHQRVNGSRRARHSEAAVGKTDYQRRYQRLYGNPRLPER